MKIKENEIYQCRDGRLAMIVELDLEHPDYNIFGYIIGDDTEASLSWTKDGKYYDGNIENYRDLVKCLPKEEYPELYL